MDITNGITEDTAQRVRVNLICNGVAYLTMDEGRGPRRIVLAALPEAEEIMIAMEGAGCKIVNQSDRINPFTLIASGFQITAARAMSNLFEVISGLDTPAQVQLPHPHRSFE